MRPTWLIKAKPHVSALLLLAFGSGFAPLEAAEGQLQFSSYFDSNVREDISAPDQTLGLTLRGRLSHEIQSSKLNIFGELLTQANLDAIYLEEESKLILSADSNLRYSLSRNLYILGGLSHFRKSFSSRNGSYQLTECSTFLQFFPGPGYIGWLGYRYRGKTLEAGANYRFSENDLEIRGRYDINPRIFLEGTFSQSNIVHTDFNALGVEDDASLVFLEDPQQDQGTEGLLHLRYQGKAIIGAQIGIGTIESNSAIGEYSQCSYRIYLTGQLGPLTFYHAVFHRIDKQYQYPGLEGESRYRDPEEPTQNLLHLRLERILNNHSIGYLQVSLLENETIFSQRYYDKTMIEVGIKYDL
ncbi:hypothetical protein ACFL4K_01110 [Candidatus Neomarinimicrobiota bacterium]